MPLISKQLRILDRLTAHLEFINPTNEDPAFALNDMEPENYGVDLRAKVFTGLTTLGTNVEMPACSILESPVPIAALHAGEEGVKKSEDWKLLLQGFARKEIAHPTRPAYELKALVEMRLTRLIQMGEMGNPKFPEEYHLGELVHGIIIGQGVVRPPEEKVSATAFFYIPLVLKISTTTANPYQE